ncbi:MAG: cobalt-precorrin-5B (C(1))-methyltransferase CbiD [Dissulfurispiraceae bacterium]|jgi:cobalt-precorrin-5B (C1)-methyltransferase
MLRKTLRSGYTTGACAAGAAKAAVLLLLNGEAPQKVEVPFPDGTRASFTINRSGIKDNGQTAWTSVIKDAGDDPDVTNGAEIIAEARLLNDTVSLSPCPRVPASPHLIIKGGKGVGVITKPGLPVAIGEHAINPVPRQMINEAVREAALRTFEITISVTDGEHLAKKTLNHRLGIVGGISILGTTGIVRPISSDAWTATISASMNVARAMGHGIIVLSAGRASEKAHMKKTDFPVESYVMMGDYLEFALLEAARHGFAAIHLCAQWAKMIKIAMATPNPGPREVADFSGYTTHVRHGAIVMKKAVEFLHSIGIKTPEGMEFNTAREIFDFLNRANNPPQAGQKTIFSKVCAEAKRYSEAIACGTPVTAHLVSYEGDIIASSE